MTDLLQNRTWRALRAVARAHGLRFNNNWDKAEATAALIARLDEGGRLKAALHRLNEAEREALLALKAQGGRIPRHRFCATFGIIRRYRPWREDAPLHPWRRPGSIAEKLWFLGLIEVEAHRAVLLPEAVAALLPPVPHPQTAVYAPAPTPDEGASQHAPLVRDVAALLATLRRCPTRPLRGGWLPVGVLRAINARVAQPENLEGVRGELQAGRTRFLHYLARASGLVSVQGGVLLPTVEAEQWLALSYEAAGAQLLRAVGADLRSRRPLWAQFRLPPVGAPIWDAALALPPGQYGLKLLATALRLETLDLTAEAQLGAAFDGPLYWAGVGRRDGERLICHRRDGIMPTDAQLHPAPDSLGITLPPLPRLRPLVALLAVATLDARGLRLDAASLARALHAGGSAAQIARALAELTGRPLPLALADQLAGWEGSAARLRLRQVALLTATSARDLDALWGDWRLRPLLGARVSPWAAEVRDARRLRQRLARRGYPVAPAEKPADSPPRGDSADPAYLWVAVRLCQALGDLLPLPFHIPSATIRDAEPGLAGRRDALQAMVDGALTAVRAALRGEVPGGVVAEQAAPEQIARAVALAQANDGALRIRYYSPAAGQQTERTIAPSRIYTRDDATYIEAWCYLDDAQRTFRLDRIMAVV